MRTDVGDPWNFISPHSNGSRSHRSQNRFVTVNCNIYKRLALKRLIHLFQKIPHITKPTTVSLSSPLPKVVKPLINKCSKLVECPAATVGCERSSTPSVLSLLSEAVGAAMEITSEPAEVMVLCQRAEVWQQVTRTKAALKPLRTKSAERESCRSMICSLTCLASSLFLINSGNGSLGRSGCGSLAQADIKSGYILFKTH